MVKKKSLAVKEITVEVNLLLIKLTIKFEIEGR